MTLRLNDVPIHDTDQLVQAVLRPAKAGQRVMILVESGTANKVMARIRVKVSRKRKELKRKKRPIAHFRIHNTTHPHTEGGKRYDALVIWVSRSESDEINELLEDTLRHG